MNSHTIVLLLLLVLPGITQGSHHEMVKDCPMHESYSLHHTAVESHGDQAMGFPHDKTTHHFRLMSQGGTVEVSANNPDDEKTMYAIRSHLKHIVVMFSNRDFTTPMLIHDSVPPGTTTMKLLKSKIHYNYEETPTGGKVRIQTDNPIAVGAIHDFLRFQINEHQTGDNLSLPQK